MSTHHATKPRRANQSITDESGRPGTARSNVGCDAIDEPCTNSTAGLPSGVPTYFSHRNRRTPPLRVQCATPVTAALESSVAFCIVLVGCRVGMVREGGSVDLRAGFLDHRRPAAFFGVQEFAECRGRV